MQRKLIISTFIVLVGVASIFSVIYDNTDENLPATNYEGLVRLGLAPSSDSRIPTEKDIFTDITLIDGEDTYLLFESRDLSKLDYGKTFIVRVN